MLNVRLACDHLFGKLLFTWLSLVMSMMVSFVLSFFPRDVLDEILNLIESVSEDFPSYSYTVQLYLFSDLRNPVNLRNLYWTALFIQWSERSSESEEPILYWFIYSVIWGIQWIWGTVTVLLYVFGDLRNQVNLSEEHTLYCFIYSVIWWI